MRKQLRTPRLVLRPPRPGDEQAAFGGWAQDLRVLRYLGWEPHAALEQTRAALAWDQACWTKRSAWTWMLVEGGHPIGQVRLVPQRDGSQGRPHHLRLGYLLAHARWGRGLMREALRAVLAEAFEQPGVWRVDAVCDTDNAASARALDALGFAREGVLRRHSLHPNVGVLPRDMSLHARLRDDAAAEGHGECQPGVTVTLTSAGGAK